MKLDYIHDEISSRKSQVVLRLVELNVDEDENCAGKIEKEKLQQKNTSFERKSHASHANRASTERDDEGIKDELLHDPPSNTTPMNRIKLTKAETGEDDDEDETCCCGCCCGCVKKMCRRKKKKDNKDREDGKKTKTPETENVIGKEK